MIIIFLSLKKMLRQSLYRCFRTNKSSTQLHSTVNDTDTAAAAAAAAAALLTNISHTITASANASINHSSCHRHFTSVMNTTLLQQYHPYRNFATERSKQPSPTAADQTVDDKLTIGGSGKLNAETDVPEDLIHNTGVVSGLPEGYYKRKVRIVKPAKTAMQSYGENHMKWKIQFDSVNKWVNPLMGWTASRDTAPQVNMEFDSLKEAIAFAEKEGFDYEVLNTNERIRRKKAYADNFRYQPESTGEAPRETIAVR